MRSVGAALQAHFNQDVTSLCYLLKIRARNGQILAVSGIDADIDYDDGGGGITYQAAIGLQQSAVQHSGGLEVDNSEATLLLADAGDFTEEQINAGVFDLGRFWLYRVNWNDLTQGHMLVQTGTTGAMRAIEGLSGAVELRGLTQQLKQSVVELYSITCRARFGSFGKFGCNFDASGLWDAGDVSSVSDEPDRVFNASSAPAATGPNGALPFVPGLIHFLTGSNAGLTCEIENVAGSTITLRLAAPYDLLVGDTYEARPDCDKRWAESCIALYDNAPNFRGEPLIPLADEGSQVTPGATLPIFQGGVLLPEPPP